MDQQTITTDNGTLQLTATVTLANATNKTVTWSLMNGQGQANISSSGTVTAVSNGTVTARARPMMASGVVGTLIITITVQVILLRVDRYQVQGATSVITTEEARYSLALRCHHLAPREDSDLVVTNGTGQATINSSGLVTAVANGTVTARVTANDGIRCWEHLPLPSPVRLSLLLVYGVRRRGVIRDRYRPTEAHSS